MHHVILDIPFCSSGERGARRYRDKARVDKAKTSSQRHQCLGAVVELNRTKDSLHGGGPGLVRNLSVPLLSSTQALRPSSKPTAVSLEFCTSFLMVVQSSRQRCQRNETSTVLSRGQKRHLITFAETCSEPSLAKKYVERSVAIYRQARVLRDIPTARRLECLV
jgi:hypothetical protein